MHESHVFLRVKRVKPGTDRLPTTEGALLMRFHEPCPSRGAADYLLATVEVAAPAVPDLARLALAHIENTGGLDAFLASLPLETGEAIVRAFERAKEASLERMENAAIDAQRAREGL